MSIKPIVFNNDIQGPNYMKLKNHLRKSKEDIDYENGIKAIKQRNDLIKSKRALSQNSSNPEFNCRAYHEENWAPRSDNVAKLTNSTNSSFNQEDSKKVSKKNNFNPAPPPNNNGSPKRRPIPIKSKRIQ